MNVIGDLALYGWLPFVALLFGLLPPRLAVLTACIGGVLFLPMGGYQFASGLPVYDKITLPAFGTLVVAAIFDAKRFTAFRPKLFDVVPVLMVLQALVSSLLVGNGIASLQTLIDESMRWLAPYLLGRLYFSDLRGLRDLAMGIVIGGLIYVPLCAYELRMSPVLHTRVYGFHQHSFMQARRGEGWRPVVFMQHGLMVGFWMSSAALVAVWLWRCGALRSLYQLPIWLLAGVLLVISVMCKSFGATTLMIAGLAALFLARTLRAKWVLLLLFALPLVYQGVRATQTWDGGQLIAVTEAISPARASSLSTRLRAEEQYTVRALQRPLWGWGGWGSYRVDEKGQNLATVDGLWLYFLGKFGLIGLGLFNALLLLPVLRFIRNYPVRSWSTPVVAPAAAVAMVVLLYMIDNLFNAMINHVYALGVGGLAGLAPPVGDAVRRLVPGRSTPPAATPAPGVGSATPSQVRQ